jgi:hypothetical protein
LDFRFSRDRSGDFNNGADSADDVQRQVWHKVEQQDTDFKQRHAGVMDGIKSIILKLIIVFHVLAIHGRITSDQVLIYSSLMITDRITVPLR